MSTYKIDPDHSDIRFKVKHMMISTVSGIFKKFTATLDSDKEDFSDAKITFVAEVDSIDTKNADRDAHLKSDDFFNAEQFPELKFVSTSIEKAGDNKYSLKGDFTIRDITNPITLAVEYNGTETDPYGQVKSGFEIKGKISRKEYGLKWNAITEAGGVVVSDEVKLDIEVQMVKQAELELV